MKKTEVPVVVKEPNFQTFTVTIKGLTPLIFNKWSEKAIQMMLDKQMRKSDSNKREAKNPEEQGEATFYKNRKGEVCILALSIKTSIVSSVRNVEGLTMAKIKQCIFVKGDQDDLIPVKYKEKSIRRDMVHIGQGISDVRFRGQITEWSAQVPVTFYADAISAEQVVNLLQIAGFTCGIGEWRPERGGNFGTFEVVV